VKVMVTGSRRWKAREPIQNALFRHFTPGGVNILIVGDASGADCIAADIARLEIPFEVKVHRAAWGKHGKAAGPMRNQRMVDQKPDVCLAFPTVSEDTPGSGTWDAVRRARKAGIPVEVLEA